GETVHGQFRARQVLAYHRLSSRTQRYGEFDRRVNQADALATLTLVWLDHHRPVVDKPGASISAGHPRQVAKKPVGGRLAAGQTRGLGVTIDQAGAPGTDARSQVLLHTVMGGEDQVDMPLR